MWQWERGVVGVAVGEGCGEGGRGVGMGMEVGRGVKWTTSPASPPTAYYTFVSEVDTNRMVLCVIQLRWHQQ